MGPLAAPAAAGPTGPAGAGVATGAVAVGDSTCDGHVLAMGPLRAQLSSDEVLHTSRGARPSVRAPLGTHTRAREQNQRNVRAQVYRALGLLLLGGGRRRPRGRRGACLAREDIRGVGIPGVTEHPQRKGERTTIMLSSLGATLLSRHDCARSRAVLSTAGQPGRRLARGIRSKQALCTPHTGRLHTLHR